MGYEHKCTLSLKSLFEVDASQSHLSLNSCELLVANEALSALERTAEPPSVENYVCILQKCRREKNLVNANFALMHLCEYGLEAHRAIGNHLVPTFVECDSLPDALHVFNGLAHRSEHAWTSLIKGYVEIGESQHALNMYKKMQEEYVYRSRTLVDVYAKCGSLAESWDLFNKLPVHDAVLWNSLIAAYADYDLGEQVLSCLQQMQLEGISPVAFTLTCSLKACGSVRAIARGREIHIEIAKRRCETDPSVSSILVDMYAKCGSLKEAQETLDKVPVQDVFSWTALIAGCAEQGLCEEALNYFYQMQWGCVSPDAVTLVCSLKACANIGALDKGREIHVEVARQGSESRTFVGSTLVDMYVKCGSLSEALEVFNKFPVRNVIEWTALIAGYADHGLGEESLICFQQMQMEGVSPNAVTVVCSLKACGTTKAINKGREIHAKIFEMGYEGNCSVNSTLVDMYAKCGSFSEALVVFDRMPVQDVVVWTSLIAGYAECGLGELALSCFQRMQAEGVLPDAASWNAVILAFAEEGDFEKAFKLYAQMQEQGVFPNDMIFVSILKACGNISELKTGKKIQAQIYGVGRHESTEGILANALIDMYGKCGSMIDALQVFDAMSRRFIVTWNALINGYAHQGESEIVFHLLETMRREGVQPDGITFLKVLTVCSHAGLVDKGWKYMEVMTKEYGIGLTIRHHNIMVDLLGRAGQLDDAFTLLEQMPYLPDFVTWSTVLSACRKWGNIELGSHAFQCAMRLDGRNAALFVLMSNIYMEGK